MQPCTRALSLGTQATRQLKQCSMAWSSAPRHHVNIANRMPITAAVGMKICGTALGSSGSTISWSRPNILPQYAQPELSCGVLCQGLVGIRRVWAWAAGLVWGLVWDASAAHGLHRAWPLALGAPLQKWLTPPCAQALTRAGHTPERIRAGAPRRPGPRQKRVATQPGARLNALQHLA